MSLRSSSTQSLVLKSRTTSQSTRSPHSNLSTALTVTEFQVRVTDSPSSTYKTSKSTLSELSLPGSSSSVFRQQSSESVHSQCESKNDSETTLVSVPDDQVCVVTTIETPIDRELIFPSDQEEPRCSEEQSNNLSVEYEKPVVPMATCISFDLTNDKVKMRRQVEPEQTSSVEMNEAEVTTVTPPDTNVTSDKSEVSENFRITKSTVKESKYKLTDKVMKKIKQTNPIISGRIIDHYYRYGKPPFRNFGVTRDPKSCRY